MQLSTQQYTRHTETLAQIHERIVHHFQPFLIDAAPRYIIILLDYLKQNAIYSRPHTSISKETGEETFGAVFVFDDRSILFTSKTHTTLGDSIPLDLFTKIKAELSTHYNNLDDSFDPSGLTPSSPVGGNA